MIPPPQPKQGVKHAMNQLQIFNSFLEVKERSAWQRFLERRYSYPSEDLKAQVQPQVPRYHGDDGDRGRFI